MRWAEHVAYIEAIRNVGLYKLEGNISLKIYRCKVEDNIKTKLRIIWCDNVCLTHLFRNRDQW
jgi:hypothetical protein